MFGTFVCETEHLDYYGLAKQYDTFDPVWASGEHIERVTRNVENGANPFFALFRRRVKHKWVFDPMALIRPHPEPKHSLWTVPKTSYRKKLDKPIPSLLKLYLTLVFLFQLATFILQGEYMKAGDLTLGGELIIRQLLFFSAISCIGRLLDGFKVGRAVNTMRVMISPILIKYFLPRHDEFLYYTSMVDLVLFLGVSMSLVGTAH
jgi:hypothetical protein